MPLDVLTKMQLGSRSRLATYKFAKSRYELLKEAQKSLRKASRCMKYGRPLECQMGDKISSKRAQRGLILKCDGPFEVMKKVVVVYKSKLLDKLKIHLSFPWTKMWRNFTF